MANSVAAVPALGAALAVVDAAAKQQGRGADYITGPAAAQFEQHKAGLIGKVQQVSATVLAYFLELKLPRVRLDPNEPFSDASLSAALSGVLEVEVVSIKNVELLKDGMRRAAAAKVSEAVGSPFVDLFDETQLRADVLRAIGKQASGIVPGLNLENLGDAAQLRADLRAFALLKIGEVLGVDLGGDLNNVAAVKDAVIAWAEPIVRERVAAEGETGKAGLKMSRRNIRLRAAQRRFRERWGNRDIYQPI